RFYRQHSVPKHPDSAKPRGLFSTRPEGPPPPAQPPRETRAEFPRPDLAPDGPPSTPPRGGYAPPPGASRHAPPPPNQRPPHPPPPQSRPGGPQSRPTPASTSRPTPASTSRPPPPPPQTTRHPSSPPQTTRPPSPPQTTRPSSPPQPPSLEVLVDMSDDEIGKLSVHALKGILRANHVPLGQVLEKADLVSKVKALVGEERRMVDERRAREAAERGEAKAYDAPWTTAQVEVPSPTAQPPARGPSPAPSLREAETAQPHTSSAPPPARDGGPPAQDGVPPAQDG
ncbi:hypothetical protein K525DRAFT_275644, partial [Schizophyllum commune Loenen D]